MEVPTNSPMGYTTLRHLKELTSFLNEQSSVVVGCSGHVATLLSTNSPIHIEIRPLGSGLERTRTGVMNIRVRDPFRETTASRLALHYVTGERSVKLFLPGSDQPLV